MRSRRRAVLARTLPLCVILSAAPYARAHGFVGDRFFPPTIATDDPFATDELSLPTVSVFKNPGSPPDWETDIGAEFDKEILPHFALGLSDTDKYIKPSSQPGAGGWDNIELSAKYQLWQNDPHEAIVSLGLITDFGPTGDSNVGADPFNTYTPTLYFGKGFGDLPDFLAALQPLALTGTLAESFPNKPANPNQFQLGLALEYSLPYLQQHVRDIGLPRPFRDMIPLLELTTATNENRSQHGQTTGTLNPGVLWETPYYQLGIEADVPINGHTGPHIGATVNLQIFIDDVFPALFGHPLFFGESK